jgi:hypothetical protein
MAARRLDPSRHTPAVCVAALAVLGATVAARSAQDAQQPTERDTRPLQAIAALADAPADERDAIERLRNGATWVRRAFAVLRLARFDCPTSAVYIEDLANDAAWQTRSFALLAAALRGMRLPATVLADEGDPRVLRSALRCRFEPPRERVVALIERLERSASRDDRLLAVELALALDPPLDRRTFDPEEELGSIIMGLDRVEAGVLSPRLAAITGAKDSGRSWRWREWYRKNRKDLGLHGAFLVPKRTGEARGSASEPLERGSIAAVSSERFTAFERHVKDLAAKPLDLVIAIDCTASMSGELAECQAGVDALVLFALGVVRDVRIALVGYRDRSDRWETRSFDFTTSLAELRDRLWQLGAEGGGDRPESVGAALKDGYFRMSWRRDAQKSLVLIGDAPPHPGTGEQCVAWARQAFAAGVRTYTIAPRADVPPERGNEPPPPPPPPPDPTGPPAAKPEDDKPGLAPWWERQRRMRDEDRPWRRQRAPGEVEYWKEIAEAGGGRTVRLPRDASLIAEIAGLALGDDFQWEFDALFDAWTALCR